MTDPNMPSDSELKKRELDLKEQELAIKTDELAVERRKIMWWSGPLALAVVGGLIAWGTSMAVEVYKAGQRRMRKCCKRHSTWSKQRQLPKTLKNREPTFAL